MNLLPDIKSREGQKFFTRLWRAIRQGTFPVEFAGLWAGSGVERRKLIEIGAQIENIMLGRGDNQDKGERLGRLAVRVDRLLGARTYDEKSPQRQLADMLFQWADERRKWFAWDVKSDQFQAVGYVVGAATLAIAMSVALGKSYEAALAEVENDPNWLADMAFLLIRSHGLPVSLTDVRDTIRFGMTAHGRLRDWLLPGKIERQYEREAERLARFIGVADLRGMSISEIIRRCDDAVSEHGHQREGAHGAHHR